MRKLAIIQAFYCLSGIGFFVQDLFAKKPMGQAMIDAFIWPYAQWPLIKHQALVGLKPILALLQ